ncbi:holin-associated N-acetylmuramidase [Amaricoccus solimangrovi]|uniref:Peptidoglycan-binding protein n=1 Tax=Amaricoccus solimangrovi TaxID=2589815 RepID=A0A501WQB6_9RHOB|nr:holin-associated N-acetylmuramidase [Amaricoccus solimangrovi]TPE49437.1 peptidoglycan-binding protein [Amaricoccus solimangrovi]
MQTVESLAREIVRREGGYVNDPDDPGGATKFGVTLATLRSLRGARAGIDDLRALSAEEAAEIYVRFYYARPRIDLLPEPLRASVFDMQVNAGANAVRILQRLMTAFGMKLRDDGVIGQGTARAAQKAMAMAPGHLVDAYGIERRNYYYRLGDLRPASRKFARARDGGKGGWITRAEEFIAARFHFTRAQHDERVRTWG